MRRVFPHPGPRARAPISTFHALLIGHVVLSLAGAMWVHRLFGARLKAGHGAQSGGGQDGTVEPTRTVPFAQIAATVAWLGLEFLALSVLAVPLDLSDFGVIHLAYLHLFVSIPVIGLGLAALHFRPQSPTRLGRASGVLVTAALGLGCLGYYMTYVVPFDLEVTHSKLKVSDRNGRAPAAEVAARKPLRIGLLADLQARRVTDFERRAVAALMAEKPDLILIPGDIIHQMDRAAYVAAIPEFRELLGTLSAPAGVYYVRGNTDPKDIEPLLFEGTEVVGLVDEIVTIPYGGSSITLGGLALAHHKRTKGKELMQALAKDPGDGDIRLLLTHLPDPVLFLPENSAVDLVLAGHTHGGQIQLPLFGPPITLSHVPRKIAAGGLHDYQGNAIYVSRGIGVERDQAPRMRLLARPEVSLITLE